MGRASTPPVRAHFIHAATFSSIPRARGRCRRAPPAAGAHATGEVLVVPLAAGDEPLDVLDADSSRPRSATPIRAHGSPLESVVVPLVTHRSGYECGYDATALGIRGSGHGSEPRAGVRVHPSSGTRMHQAPAPQRGYVTCGAAPNAQPATCVGRPHRSREVEEPEQGDCGRRLPELLELSSEIRCAGCGL